MKGGVNTYSYAAQNPNNWFDQDGRFVQAIPVIIGVATVTAAAIIVGNNSAEKEKTLPMASTSRNPGNCTSGRHRQLQHIVDRECKRKRSCNLLQSCPELLENMGKNIRCALAREKINSECYSGGDLGHRVAATHAWLAAGNCGGIYAVKQCCDSNQ